MEVLALLPIGFVGSVFWFVSAEATAIGFGSQGYNPFLVGVLAATGQTSMYCLLYVGGEQLVHRWRWLTNKVELLRARYGERLERSYLATTGVASIIGIPPLVALVALASGFRVRFRHVIPIAYIGRIARFTILAVAGESILAWWNSLTGCGGSP